MSSHCTIKFFKSTTHRVKPSLLLLMAVLTVGAMHWPDQAEAQTQAPSPAFPTKQVTIILPYAPGGATDIIARNVGQKLSEMWGQPVIVDNRAGGNGNIGAAFAARAAADGYTLLMATSSHAINETLYKKLDYSLSKDFTALSNAASVPLVLVINTDIKVDTVKQLAAYGQANAGKINFGSGGVGTAAHLAGEQFNTETNLKIQHIAYKGGALATNDLIGGQIQMMFANLPEVLSNIKAGKLKPLAVTGATRHPQLPDTPTFVESGYPGVTAESWFGFFTAKGTPAAIVNKLGADISAAVRDPGVQAKLKALGAEPIGNSPEVFQAFVPRDIKKWGAIVQQSGATAE